MDGASEAELTEPEFTEAELTISVRFTAAEIVVLRRRAKDAGMEPTAFLRRAALAADPLPLDQTLQTAGTVGAIGTDDVPRMRDMVQIGTPPPASAAAPDSDSAEQISTAQAKAMLSGLIAGAERERTS
jgi:hypothetical protein